MSSRAGRVTNARVLLEQYAGRPFPGWDDLIASSPDRVVEAGELVWDFGSEDGVIYIVQEGLFAVEAMRSNGELVPISFQSEGEVVTNPELLLTNPWLKRILDAQVDPRLSSVSDLAWLGSLTRVRALERSHLTSIDMAAMADLVMRNMAWGRTIVVMTVLHSMAVQAEVGARRLLTTEEQYLRLCYTRPDLLRRLKQKDIAAYLDISEAGMSRMLARMRRDGRL